VRDTGEGIAPELLPHVFEPSAQGDPSRGGLGIGLALVRTLVEMHGGSVKADSQGPGAGSTFTVTLPVASAPQPAPASGDAVLETTARALNVLVVDDNVDSAQTTRWMLELIGHQAVVAHDGRTAIDTAESRHPDVILLDIGMPEMDGYAVCRELRGKSELKDTVIVAQTGWGQESDRLKAFEAGFDHHITKPVSLDMLSRLLNDITSGQG